MAKPDKPLLSASRRAAIALLPLATSQKWTATKLAQEAGCTIALAGDVLKKHQESSRKRISEYIHKSESKLVTVARNAQERALARLPELESLLDRAQRSLERSLPNEETGEDGVPVALDEFGQPIPTNPSDVIKAVQGVIKAGKDLHGYMEQVTGLDVVKAVSVRTQTSKDGPLVSWDGVGALDKALAIDAVPVIESLPASAADDDGEDFC